MRHNERLPAGLSGWALVLSVLLAASLYGQEYRGRIQGSVLDASQAAVAGATVTLLHVNTGVSTTRQSSETGHYLFDMAEPGSYTLTVESKGFSKFARNNVLLQSRGDVTVDATLRPGDIRETVTVTAEATAVQFNTSKLETTVDSKLVRNLPQLYRNPFLLAQLDPAVERNDNTSEYDPYMSWGANQQRVGGGANYSSDVQVDGSPVGIGVKTSYVPSPDMVQEVNVQQNAVDAEYGHSSGSAISLTTKAGTNEWHGNAFYQGQYPWANALENRVNRRVNLGRNHMYGGTLGHRILKNKLFNFVAYEGWEKTQPSTLENTLPTDLERQGDFSQSLNVDGALRAIYDPWSTQTSADGRTITRTPYPGNKIPASVQDPIATAYMAKLWKPNRPGIGNYHYANYIVPLPVKYPYKNFSDRVDYIVNEKLRASGRISLFRTPVTTSNPTGSELFQSDRGSQRDATSYSGDVTYTLDARTVINLHGDYHNFVDASKLATDYSAGGGWAKVWPTSSFYKPVFADPTVPVLIPRMSIIGPDGRNVDMGPGGGFWWQHPTADSFNIKIAQQRGGHYLKAGFDTRGSRGPTILGAQNPGFGFHVNGTNSTYVNPNAVKSGDAYATFLIGSVVPTGGAAGGWNSGATSMPILNVARAYTRFFGGYINDDWKITRKLTLNLGLRYEYDQAYRDPEDRLTRQLDLSSPIPEFQGANAPPMPAQVKQFYGGTWTFNGAFQFTDDNHRGQWDPGKGVLSPRIGAAYRLNDKTSLRAAMARYSTPYAQMGGDSLFGPPYVGFQTYTGAPDAIQGVPQMRLRDPFPALNPIIPAYRKSLGRYTGLGDSFTAISSVRPQYVSDRVNVSVQRQVPGGMVLDVTYYLNYTHGAGNYNMNLVDPRIAYQYKGAVNQSVPNPFNNILPVEKFPGPLRYQQNVSLLSLMKAYPHYGNLNVIDHLKGFNMKYQSLQMRLQKTFSNGYSLLAAYNYHFERNQILYDDIATYLKQFTWDSSNNARHRLNVAGTWEIPLGKGRAFLGGAPRLLDAVVGGWDLTSVVTWRSGRFLVFGGMVANGDPRLPNPTPEKWFDTSVFSQLPAYTPRANPRLYPGLTAPGLFNMDASLVKGFRITERFRFQLRMDVFNALNGITWGDPNTGVTSSTFGRSTDQLSNTFGRRTQLGLRLEF